MVFYEATPATKDTSDRMQAERVGHQHVAAFGWDGDDSAAPQYNCRPLGRFGRGLCGVNFDQISCHVGTGEVHIIVQCGGG